jgi:hypothetical protein
MRTIRMPALAGVLLTLSVAAAPMAQAGLFNKIKNAVTGAVNTMVDKTKGAAESTADFFKRIAGKTGEAFSKAGIDKLAALSRSTFESVKAQAKAGYEKVTAAMKKVATDALKSTLVAKAEEMLGQFLDKVNAAKAAFKALLEDSEGRDRVWRLLKGAAQRKIDQQMRDDGAWIAKKLGFVKAQKTASRREAQDAAMCGFAPWPQSFSITAAVSGTLAKGAGITAEGSIGVIFDLGSDGNFKDTYNMGIVASVGGGIAVGTSAGALDVMLGLGSQPTSQAGGGYISLSGEFHKGKGLQAALDWNVSAENFTHPNVNQLIPSVFVGAGVGAGAKVSLNGGYSWLLTSLH